MQDSLVLVYHPKEPTSFHIYKRPSPFRIQPSLKSILAMKENSAAGSHPNLPASSPLLKQPVTIPATTKVMLMGVNYHAQHGLATAIDENGGIGVFLFLFAKVLLCVYFYMHYWYALLDCRDLHL
jgi:hypothetical protein